MENREIKFRLIKDGKIVGYERFNPKGELNCWEYSLDNVSWTNLRIIHTEKNQFTNSKDKNGKEIYSGDIVKSDGIHNGEKVVLIGKIEFEDGCFNLLWKWESPEGSGTYSIRPLSRENEYLEVIGNIYENPELLK